MRNRNTLGEIPTLTDELVSGIIASPLPGVVERAVCLLKHVINGQGFLGEHFTDRLDPSFYAVTYSINALEMEYFLNFLCDEGFFKKNAEHDFEVTPKGYMRYEVLQSQSSPSAQGFVAMWFDPAVQPAYDYGLALGIRRAGYDPLRVDSVEHVGKIDDEIIAQIKRSRFVVADFTGHRAGVYFEAGFALGLNIPVIWCCRNDHMDGLHFDIRQFSCVDWTDPRELAHRLHMRIEAVVGAGPRGPVSAAS